MRPAWFAVLSLGVLACSDSSNNTKVDPVTVQWMDWPAEVNAGQPFRTRLVVWGVCAQNPRFHAGASADQSAVSFAPFWVVDDAPIFCTNEPVAPLLVIALDTAGIAPGLPAPFARTYEMRASAQANTYTVLESLPLRTFGNVTVRPTGADESQRNAAGVVSLETNAEGCARVRPIGLYSPNAALVLEDQADTAALEYAFVYGYIHDTAVPVCGETRVFHLTARQ